MMVAHFLILAMEFLQATFMTPSQYSLDLRLIYSEAQMNLTLDIFIPTAFHTSTKYLPTVLIFSKSPSNLLLSIAK